MKLVLRVLLVALFIGAIAAGWWYWPQLHAKRFEQFAWDEKTAAAYGQFGDAFGAFTALFTGVAFVAVALTLYLQMIEMRRQQTEVEDTKKRERERTQTEALFDLHREFNTKEILGARQRALDIFKKHSDKNPTEMYDVLTPDERTDTGQVIFFYQRLYLAIKFDRIHVDLVGDLFGDVFYWWWFHSLEAQVLPINRDSSRRINDLKEWFDQNCNKKDIARWIARAKQDMKSAPQASQKPAEPSASPDTGRGPGFPDQ